MLGGVHPNPADAARELLGRFTPVVSIETAKRANSKASTDTPVSAERWTLGLIMARWLVRLGLQEEVERKPMRSSNTALRDKLFSSMSQLETERMVAIFADDKGRMISQELVAEGDHGQLRLSLRQIFTKALKRDARRMIIAHNHPSGCATPSDGDILSTRRLSDYARSLGIVLEDHLIIGHEDITSMRKLGLF